MKKSEIESFLVEHLSGVRETLNAHLDGIERAFVAHLEKVDEGVDGRIASLEERVDRLEGQISGQGPFAAPADANGQPACDNSPQPDDSNICQRRMA